MRFLVDAQLPPALARWLDARGYGAAHVSDLEMSAASDAEIWRVRSEDTEPTVIWLRIGNTRKSEVLRWFESLWPDIAAAVEAGEQLVEVD